MSELAARVRAVLRRVRPASPKTLSVTATYCWTASPTG